MVNTKTGLGGATSHWSGRGESPSVTRRRWRVATLCVRLRICSALPKGVRQHWAIENSQHGVRNVRFGEDANRALSEMRRMALN